MWKKTFALLLISALLISGCGKEKDSSNNNSKEDSTGTITCTMSEVDEDNLSTNSTVVVNYKNNIVTKVEQTTIEELDESMVSFMVTFGNAFAEQLENIDGINYSFTQESDTSIKSVMSIDYESLDIDALKEIFGDSEDNDLYSSTNITLDEFKSNNLDGYQCN